MLLTQKKADNGRLHLTVALSASEVAQQLEARVEEVKATDDLPYPVLKLEAAQFLQDSNAQNLVRNRLMEDWAHLALVEAGIIPVSQLIYLTKERVVPQQGYEFIVSLVATPAVDLCSYDAVEAFAEELAVLDAEVENELAELAERNRRGQNNGLPTVCDEWVQQIYPGIGGLEGLRARIREELFERKRSHHEQAQTDHVLRQLARRVVSPVPENVFDARFAEVYRNFCRDIKTSSGQGIEEYFYVQGIDERQFKAEMATEVRDGLMQGFALDAYARHYKLEPSEQDYLAILAGIAPGEEEQMRFEYLASGRMYILDEAARRNHALRHLLDNAL